MKNPWLKKKSYGNRIEEMGPASVEDRLYALKSFDVEKLRKVIDYPATQKTVRIAAERRLRKLTK